MLTSGLVVVCVFLLSLQQPLPGDAVKGRALVESNRCFDCHRIGETGSRLGPDLSEIGKLRSPELLQRAIVAPDAEVLPEHRFVRIITSDGASVVGRLLNQDAFSIQLITEERLRPERGAGGQRGEATPPSESERGGGPASTTDVQLQSYLKSNLREHTILEKGMMPSYEGKLTAQQVADIVSYLESLTGGEK